MTEEKASLRDSALSAPPSGRVFVTGASGFVGRYILRALLAQGYEPVCLVRDPDRLARQLSEETLAGVRLARGDLFEPDALATGLHACRAAVHLVGIILEQPGAGQTFERVHVEGTRRIVEASERAGVNRYVHMSALGAGAEAGSAYHRSKWDAERIVRASRLAWTIFRPSLIHGPEGEFMRMMKFLCTSRLRQPVMPYFGRGTGLIQPVSVRDVAECFVKCLTMPETVSQAYELGGPQRMTWKALYDACALAMVGRRRLKLGVPVAIAKLLARTVVPAIPSLLLPFKFNVDQVSMSQQDNVCDIESVERTFGIKMRPFHQELASYADRI